MKNQVYVVWVLNDVNDWEIDIVTSKWIVAQRQVESNENIDVDSYFVTIALTESLV